MRRDTGRVSVHVWIQARQPHVRSHQQTHACTVPSEVRCAVIKLSLGVQLLIMWIIWVKLDANTFHEMTPRLYPEPTGWAGARPWVVWSQVQAALWCRVLNPAKSRNLLRCTSAPRKLQWPFFPSSFGSQKSAGAPPAQPDIVRGTGQCYQSQPKRSAPFRVQTYLIKLDQDDVCCLHGSSF